MDAAGLIALALKTSIVLAVLALGLGADLAGIRRLLGEPGRLIRLLVSMYGVMPLAAAALALVFGLHPAVKIVLVALAVTPVPPLVTRKAMKAGERASVAVGLLAAVAVLSILVTPLAVSLVGAVFGVQAWISPATVAAIVLVTVLAPLAVGLLAVRLAPAVARRAAAPIAVTATVLLVASALPVLVMAWPAIATLIGGGALVAIVAFVLTGLVAGHLLGGPEPEDQAMQSLFTAARHPGVALAIAGANFPAETLVPGAIVLYLLVSVVVGVPFVAWSRRRGGRDASRPRAARAA
jgi:BASS family bile acid:Na+ symporter